MTKFAKALVFVNLFVGVGLFAWAISLYSNRLAYFDVKEAEPPVVGLFTQLKQEQDEQIAAITANQTGYAKKAFQVQSLEQIRLYRRDKLAERLNLVRVGDDERIVFRQWLTQQAADPLLRLIEPIRAPALIDVNRPDAEVPAVKSARDRDLQGLGYLRSEMAKQVKAEADTILRIREARKKMGELNVETDKTQDEVFAQKVIRLNLLDQKDYLADVRVNWDEQLKTLQERQKQLSKRLAVIGQAAANTDVSSGK
jgi:hypothetical protein